MSFEFPSDDAIRVEFHNLCDQRDAITAKAAPYRGKYEQARAECDALWDKKVLPAESAMKSAEAGLDEIANKIARLSRMIGHKTGERPAASE
jgi:hypothetical protein